MLGQKFVKKGSLFGRFEDTKISFWDQLTFNQDVLLITMKLSFFRGPTDLGPVKVIEGVRSLLEKCIIVRGKDKFWIFLVKTQGTFLGLRHLTIFFF